MAMDDGGLGFAIVKESKLSIWSREDGEAGPMGWVQRKSIELEGLLPSSALSTVPTVIAVVDGWCDLHMDPSCWGLCC
ncbi:hypothetical protein ACP4OV_017007 [Aristida adscensionis]